MAVKNDARTPFFIFGKPAGAICAQLCENRVQGLFTAPVLESFNKDAVRIFSAEVLCKFYFAPDRVVMLHDASDKANDNHGRAWRRRQ